MCRPKDSAKSRSRLPKLVRVIFHALKRTGHYCDGTFGPEHVDFHSFCGLFHTRQSAMPLAIAFLLYLIALATMFSVLRICIGMIANLSLVPFVLLMVFGIWREKAVLMVPAIVLLAALATLVCIPLAVSAVFNPTLAVYRLFDSMNDGDTPTQLTLLLLIILTDTFSLLFMQQKLEGKIPMDEKPKCKNCCVRSLEETLKKELPKYVA
ncbi:hypothetical protein M3Y99_00024800 [Aphelenchoides fujianensis]|nr:hypothetical protein M3Y99_00024800 [Aphelenchoides fujianensis]